MGECFFSDINKYLRVSRLSLANREMRRDRPSLAESVAINNLPQPKTSAAVRRRLTFLG